MIIVEGPDGAGKSTLVEQLCEEFPQLTVGERGTNDRSKLFEVTKQDTYTALAGAVKGDQYPKIWDRLFFSEMVYAPIVGRDCEFTVEEQNFIRRIMRTLGCPVIACLPPFDAVLNNAMSTEQMDGVKENLESIYSTYLTVFKDMPWVIWYDYTGEQDKAAYKDYGSIVRGVRTYLDRREDRSWS